MSLVEDTGFDAIDGGALAECWRQQPITRAYCSELTAAELRAALATADRARAPLQREKMVKEFMALGDKITTEDIVRCTGSQVLRHELTGGTQAETERAAFSAAATLPQR